MTYIVLLVIGIVTGLLTTLIFRRRHPIMLLNVIVGVIGVFVSAYLLPRLFLLSPISPETISFPALVISLGGALVLLGIVNFIRREHDVKNAEIESRWVQIQDKIHARWGKLTEDDITGINGSHEQFVLTLQTRYGCTRREAEDQLQGYLKSVLEESGPVHV